MKEICAPDLSIRSLTHKLNATDPTTSLRAPNVGV